MRLTYLTRAMAGALCGMVIAATGAAAEESPPDKPGWDEQALAAIKAVVGAWGVDDCKTSVKVSLIEDDLLEFLHPDQNSSVERVQGVRGNMVFTIVEKPPKDDPDRFVYVVRGREMFIANETGGQIVKRCD